MKKYILISLLVLPVFLFVFLVKVTGVSALGNGIPVTDNPPNAKRPCDNAYTWKVLQPGTNGAPALDATKYGMGNDGQGNGCSQHSDCPKNQSDAANVDQNTSNWCYEFGVGNRCIQLQHIQGQSCPGYVNPGGGTCSIDNQSPDIGVTCAACLSSKTSPTNVPGVITNIKNMDSTNFNACDNRQILNKWCNGFGAEAARQCNELKTGVCAISCGGSLPNPNPSSKDTGGSATACNGNVAYSGNESRYASWNNQCSGALQANGSGGIGQNCCETGCGAATQCDEQSNVGGSNNCDANCQVYTSPTPVRPDLCQSTSANKTTLNSGDSITVTSTAKTSVKKFMFAFFNNDNTDPNSGPKLISFGGQSYTPTVEVPTAQTQASKTFNFADLSQPDGNWGGRIPQNVQVNGYFFDNQGNQSLPKPACVANFTLAAAPASTPTPTPPVPPTTPPAPPAPTVTTRFYRVTDNIADFAADLNKGWKDYTAVPTAESLTLSSVNQTPGEKTIWVEFKYSTDKVERHSNKITVLGEAPKNPVCSLSFEGSSTILNIRGANFGSVPGTVKSGDTPRQVRSWKNDNVQVIWPDALSGQNLNVTLTNTDGQSVDVSCSSSSQLALGAKVFCRAPSSHQTDNVNLTLVRADGKGTPIKQRVSIDKDGVVQGLNQKLEDGQKYNLSLKAPKGLRRTITDFTAGDGTTTLSSFILPIGDIFPLDGGDGNITVSDRAVLNTQWNISSDASGRSGDFNLDGRVNSIDWACMRYDFGKVDDPEAVPDQPAPSSNPNPEGQFCGGIAGNLPENKCPAGYRCQLEGNYPDASGKCVPI